MCDSVVAFGPESSNATMRGQEGRDEYDSSRYHMMDNVSYVQGLA